MVISKVKGEKLTDDKTMIMERVIQLVSNLPSNSKLRVELTNTFLGELWNSLEHSPGPSMFVGDEFMYRRADGSYNVSTPFESFSSAVLNYVRRISCFPNWELPALATHAL